MWVRGKCVERESFQYAYFCKSCRKKLDLEQQIFFVESAGANYFCGESCVQRYYSPIARHYYQEHLRIRGLYDIPCEEFPKYEQYAALTMQAPSELWLDKSPAGQEHLFFIGSFSDEGRAFHYVVLSFALKKEPTFILLSFPTRDNAILDLYRKGKEITVGVEQVSIPVENRHFLTPQSNTWGEYRFNMQKEMLRHRKSNDIQQSDFGEHGYLLDETINHPDEAWELVVDGERVRLTLIGKHSDSLHYVVVCVLTNNDSSGTPWRVLYHFPTEDPSLVARYRQGYPCKSMYSLSIMH